MAARETESKPLLIIVSGAPCTGKSTIATRVAREFGLPFLSKDAIKESLFDSLGTGGRDWSRRLGLASIELLFKLIATQLEAGRSLVAESNFYREFDTPRFEELRGRFDFDLLQVHCFADTSTLLSRYRLRGESRERHPGHTDHLAYEELARRLPEGAWDPMDIGGQLLTIDTTDFANVDLPRLLHAIRGHVAPRTSTLSGSEVSGP